MKKTYIPKVSVKQAIENALRRKIKFELIKEQIENYGYTFCMSCGASRRDFRNIELRHRISIGRGGKTDKENCFLWCGYCHSAEHGIHEHRIT